MYVYVCVCVQVTQVEQKHPEAVSSILSIDSGVSFSQPFDPRFSTSCERDTRRRPASVCLRVFLQYLQRAGIGWHAVLFVAAFFQSGAVPERVSGWWPSINTRSGCSRPWSQTGSSDSRMFTAQSPSDAHKHTRTPTQHFSLPFTS